MGEEGQGGLCSCYAWVMLLVPRLGARGPENRRFQMTVSAAWGGGQHPLQGVGQPRTQKRLVKRTWVLEWITWMFSRHYGAQMGPGHPCLVQLGRRPSAQAMQRLLSLGLGVLSSLRP